MEIFAGLMSCKYKGNRNRKNDSQPNPFPCNSLHTLEWIYYFDKENGIVGKVPRVKCLKEKVILTLDDQGKEQPEGTIIDEWDSKDDTIGKTEMIFQLKQILRGSASKKKEGLVEK